MVKTKRQMKCLPSPTLCGSSFKYELVVHLISRLRKGQTISDSLEQLEGLVVLTLEYWLFHFICR